MPLRPARLHDLLQHGFLWMRLLLRSDRIVAADDRKGRSFSLRRGGIGAVVMIGVMIASGCHREPEYEGRGLQAWYAALRSTSPAERSRAAVMIARAAPDHPESSDALLRALRVESDSNVHAILAEAIGTMSAAGFDAVPALEGLLTDEHPSVRSAAIRALASIARRSPNDQAKIVSIIGETLNDVDHDVRLDALRALPIAIGSQATLAARTLPELGRVALNDPLGSVRNEAIVTVATIPTDSAAASILGPTLMSQSWTTQVSTLGWMVRHPQAAQRYAAEIRKLTQSEDIRVRTAAQRLVPPAAR